MSAARPSRPLAGAPRRLVAGLGWTCALAAMVAALVGRVAAPAPPIADVTQAVEDLPRAVEGWTSAMVRYQPLAVPARADATAAANWRALAVAGRLRETTERAPSGTNLHAFGVAALQAANLDAAVQALEDARVVDPRSAALHADLAAAYLARGALPGRAIDLPRALESADHARRLNPRLPAAAFNAALALEHLHLRHEAARAWDGFVTSFGDEAGWVDEARRRRAALDAAAPVVPPSPATRADEELRRWTARAADADTVDVPDLAAHGAFYGAIADEIRRAAPAARRAIARNARDLLDADAALSVPDYGTADRLAAGVEARVAADSPLRLWAVRLRLTTGFNTATGRDQARVAGDLAAAAARLGFAALESDAQLRLGAIDFVSGRYERAHDHYAAAQRLRESLGNVRAAVSARMAAADALRMLGREPEAWDRFAANLRVGTLGDPVLEGARLSGPSQASLEAGHAAVALAFARELAHYAGTIGQQGFLANARQYEARALWRLADVEGAAEALRRGREALDAHPDRAIRDRYLAEFALAETELLSTTAPAAAVPLIADTERRLRSNVGQRLVALSVLEAQVLRRLGNVDGARAALRKGVALVDEQQRHIGQADFLPSFVDASWDVFSEFVDLEAAAGRHGEALQWLDRGFDIRRRWARGAPDAALLEASRDGALVTWLARPDGVWIWAVVDGAIDARHVPVPGDTLARKAARLSYVLTLDDAPEAVQEAVTDLARDIWWPIAGRLDRGGEAARRLALVPDPLLQRVPFALLPWSAVDDTLVVDRTATVLCPSLLACRAATSAIAADARVAALHAGQGGAGLAALPAARDEAERVGRRYAGAQVASATEATFADALATADVVHFSGHAVPDERYPGRSELLLATDVGDGVRVPLARLFGPAVRAGLVVLSACRTSRAEARRGEGGIGVAGEFLRAGVRQVLATQWDVRDDVAGEVMVLVHDALATGATPWDAVRHAQRTVRADRARHARDWAGYVAYTSVSAP